MAEMIFYISYKFKWTGIILGGFAEWHAAACAGQVEIHCVEFELADEALQLTLTLHRPRTAWNGFTRTELALEQELSVKTIKYRILEFHCGTKQIIPQHSTSLVLTAWM